MWHLRQIEILGQGFLSDLRIAFPAGLTCIIGPRGSGKTTLAEAIRYALAADADGGRAKNSFLRDNLGSCSIALQVTNRSGEEYLVSRSYPNAPTVSVPSGGVVSGVSLDRGTFLPIDAFSSGEIEDIAAESLGAKRRTLLDSLQNERLREIELALADHRRALDANADRIRASRQVIADFTEQIEELKDAKARLAALPPPAPGDQSAQLTTSTRQQSWTTADIEQLRKAYGEVGAQRTKLVDFHDQLGSLRLEVESASANAPLLQEIKDAIDATVADVRADLDRAIGRMESLQGKIQEVGRKVRLAQESQSADHAKLLEQNAALGQVLQQRTKAEADVAKLALLERKRQDETANLESILLKRRELKANYVLERDRVSDLRSEVAAQLTRDSGPTVRVQVARNGDDLAYRQLLLKGLSGSRLRSHEDLVAALVSLRPEALSQILIENDAAELESELSLGPERTRRVLDALRENVNPMELEVVPTEDRIRIELNVGGDREPLFRDAAELSRGQKCTALLPLLLARREVPLLIDQPEDNLDNHFIFETVVDSIRRLKERRQMIFITHNANIPVLAEADLVVVMDSDGRRGYVKTMGSLDECRDEIVDLLEGGHEAFERRRERYGHA